MDSIIVNAYASPQFFRCILYHSIFQGNGLVKTAAHILEADHQPVASILGHYMDTFFLRAVQGAVDEVP